MRVEKKHAHAYTRYSLLERVDYLSLIRSVVETRVHKYKSLTVHLPFEIQHEVVEDLDKARRFIYFGELLKKLFKIQLYWENAPWLNYGSWNLKYKNTSWKHIPLDIDLCLDTGHLMLGQKNKKVFLKKLEKIIEARGRQIKHLHLHENNLKSDKHVPVPGRIINSKTFKKLTKNRSYIVERGEV